MAREKKRRGLGNGLGALIPPNQTEKTDRPIDMFFGGQSRPVSQSNDANVHVSPSQVDDSSERSNKTKKSKSSKNSESKKNTSNVSRETLDVGNTKNEENKKDSDLVPVPGATFAEINLDDIIPNRDQPRQIFDEEELYELSQSIQQVGVLQPIVVRPLDSPVEEHPTARYEIIMGERRWRASRLAGKQTVPAIVRRTSDEDLLRDALLENLHRAQLNALEEAAAYQQLLDDFHCTQEELSQRIARSRPQISNTLRLLKLPALVQRRVAAGIISAGHARALLGLKDPASMEELAQRIVAENLSVRQVEEIVSLSGEVQQGENKKKRVFATKSYGNVANTLGDVLDTRVKVTMGKNKGYVKIDFGNEEDLQRILGIISPTTVFDMENPDQS
ncbi:ParB/RepB/Spo0J family partition protein [Actinotignum urinale]|uniref:ParB/RepB/Spo0J family partition protein n=1 Tax=Actinotignum urinale TaxID=190146 RepID=UPI000C80479E|nr:ParB/RepB/Spo0J family partition protein [Actinotignum urinale]WIK59604.1 ParB/RepB/Spo0J family partition protein [Actinotignum urinale]